MSRTAPDFIFFFPQPLQHSYVETSDPNVLGFGGGAFGRYLGLDEVMRIETAW